MKKGYSLFFLVLFISFSSCKNNPVKSETDTAHSDTTAQVAYEHPDWIMQGNIYEVNIRQYSKEGYTEPFVKNSNN